jgi:hypothetical protein
MIATPSYAWRGARGSGKRTQLLQFLERQAEKSMIPFEMKHSTWYLNKPTSGGASAADDDDDGDELSGKSIPYEESALHLGYDCARMSMSDKVFLQSILSRWTGQQDVCLLGAAHLSTRYLVLYHAQYLTDESVLQLQECLEQYPSFAILLTTELPVCSRLRDFCFEIPVAAKEDHLLSAYTECHFLTRNDVWLHYFEEAMERWSTTETSDCIVNVRQWIYSCLQRNLRWTDVIMYWIQTTYRASWMTPAIRAEILKTLWNAESGSGWVLVTSYRIPILWEHVHLQLARQLYLLRQRISS